MKNIDLVIFDLDGVLIDSREHHFIALNDALKEVGEQYIISKKEHLNRYDGLSTKKKLEILSTEKNLPTDKWDFIWKRKQELTFGIIDDYVDIDHKLIEIFTKLKNDGIKIWVCSNSIKETVYKILLKKGLLKLVDSYLSNEDVISPKPHPEMYWKAMITEKVLPENTMIVEDSYVGRKAVFRSGAKLCDVKNPEDVSIEKIYKDMQKNVKIDKWVDSKLNVLIPMSGKGSRFADAGYSFPKPLIEVNKKPMIQVVVENLNVDANFIYIVQKEHYEKYKLDSLLKILTPNCKIVITDGVTEGASCSALLAKKYINNDDPLLIANSDQFIEWESGEFFHSVNSPNIDGGILTMESNHPKWSYVKLNNDGNVVETKEKEVISNVATVGIYYFSKGCDFVKGAERMIEKNLRVNGEFYICPVYNELIEDGKIIKTYNINNFYGLGIPEDLNYFLNNYKKEI